MLYEQAEAARLLGQNISKVGLAGLSFVPIGVHPGLEYLRSFYSVTNHALARTVERPEWGIVSCLVRGETVPVTMESVWSHAFLDIKFFSSARRGHEAVRPRVLLVAPMSGHYATLLREQVATLVAHADVYVTDWNNVRDVPLSAGAFDVPMYISMIDKVLDFLGEDIHVVAVCQPVALVSVAVAHRLSKGQRVSSLVLMGGPIDPSRNPTKVTDFGTAAKDAHLQSLLARVPTSYAGSGRLVYPGFLQLSAFMGMNWQRHSDSFRKRIGRFGPLEDGSVDPHDRFYDEYLAVMDLSGPFYIETVERIFRNRELASGKFMLGDTEVDIAVLSEIPVVVVEGERDDICAPGQCVAFFDLVPQEAPRWYCLVKDAGHYGIFAGRGWREQVLPGLLDFWGKIEK